MQINKIRKILFEFSDKHVNKKLTKDDYFIIDRRKFNSKFWTPSFYDPNYNWFENFDNIGSISDICDIKVGIEPGSDMYIDPFDSLANDIPFIKTSELANFQINSLAKDMLPNEYFMKENQFNKTGDILYTKDGRVGATAFIQNETEFIFGSGVVRLRIKPKFNQKITPEFLFLLLSMREFGQFIAKKYTVRGTTIPHFNIGYLKEINVPKFDKKIIEEYTLRIAKAMM